METSQTSSPKIKLDFKDSKYATGRRKKSVAKVWLKKGSGKFYVNGNLDQTLSTGTPIDEITGSYKRQLTRLLDELGKEVMNESD